MYCVIQKIKKKKKNQNGYPKELKSQYLKMSFQGQDESHYWYTYSDARFDREIKIAYRISVHESYRENGRVKKKQFVICTVDYYDIATEGFSLYEWGEAAIEAAARVLNCPENTIYDLIEQKIQPLQEKIMNEFQQTEEYKVHKEHERITTLYAANKVKFNEKYGVSGKEYDKCYDVFGTLRNPEYLNQIKDNYEARKRYERESSRYYEKYYSNYNEHREEGSCRNYASKVHSEEDKEILKQFYRVLSKKFHPDVNLETDTSKQMQLLNQLKSEWGL